MEGEGLNSILKKKITFNFPFLLPKIHFKPVKNNKCKRLNIVNYIKIAKDFNHLSAFKEIVKIVFIFKSRQPLWNLNWLECIVATFFSKKRLQN